MDIQLNFVNHSNDTNDSTVVLFQKNIAIGFDELAVAWKVIEHCGRGDHHRFEFPMGLQVGASDSHGTRTPLLDASEGQMYEVVETPSGHMLVAAGRASFVHEIQVRNGLTRGAIDAIIYRSGNPLAVKTSVAPMQKAVFAFNPTLWIGVAYEVRQGEIISSATVSSINTELSLLGIASADIVMTGGGPGANATPLSFNLQNIRMP